MNLKFFTSSVARRVRSMSGLLAAVLVAAFSAGNTYAAELTYTGEVDAATGAFGGLTPVGTQVIGPLFVSDTALAAGLIGIADITSIEVNVGGFCFSTETPSACPLGGVDVPILSIDSSAITGSSGTLGGSFAITAFSPTFSAAVPIVFDLDAGRFSADGDFLGTVEGFGTLVAPAAAAPEITTTPVGGSTIDFGDVEIGAADVVQTITITNDGDADLVLDSIALSGSPANLALTHTCGPLPATLVPEVSPDPPGSCTVTLTLSTATAEIIVSSVTIMSNDVDEPTVVFPVTANIQLPATLITPDAASQAMPKFIDSVAVGGTSTGLVTVTNAGGFAALLGTATMPAAPFSLTANDMCSGQMLAAGANCTIEVQFAPVVAGDMFASSFTLDIVAPLPAALVRGASPTSTTMFVASSTLDPAATPSANPLMIADTMVNNVSAGVLTITNSGDADLTVTDISGLTAPFFLMASAGTDCDGATVPPMGTCDITVEFAPTADVDYSQTLSIVSNDPESPLDVVVEGTGTEELLPNIMVSPASVVFATPILIGNMDMESITVSNMGTADLVINGITIDSTVNFTQSNDCVSPLVPMATCTIDVTFAPMAAGPLSAEVTIDTNDPDTTLTTVTVDGTGVTPEPNIMLSAAMLDLGVETVGFSTMGSVTVTNTGSANLTISSVSIPMMSDYSQTNNCEVAPLAPMGTCTVTVTFAPTSATTITDTLSIVSDDPDAMVSTVALTGRGVLAPEPNISSPINQLDLGTGLFGETLNDSILINNNGNAILTISGVSISGPDAGEFSFGGNCTGAIAIAGSCTVSVQFLPGAPAGAKMATLSVTSDDGDTPSFDIALSGTSVMPVPAANFSAASIAFANTTVGGSASETVTVSNTGTGPLTVSSVALATAGADFSISSETCTATPVPVNGSCDVVVAFTPSSATGFANTLNITSDDPTTPMAAIPLTGTGTGVASPDIAVDVTTLAYGMVLFGQSGVMTAIITNNGDANLNVSGASVSPAGDFTAVTTCAVVIPAATCSVVVTYTPTVAGNVIATLTVASDDADTPALPIQLTGFGVVPEPEIAVSATTLTLGPVVEGNTDAMDLTITNEGMADLTISSITISGTDQSLFSQTNDCTTVAMNDTCTVTVTYAPSVAGDATAVLTIVSNDADEGSVDVALEGSATPVPMPMISVPALLDLGDVLASQPATGTLTISNNGTADLVISGVTLTGANAADFAQTNACATIAAGETCDVSVVFTPSAPGAATVDVVIASNDADTPSATTTVNANGLVPVAMIDNVALDVGSVRIGESGSASVTVSNSGNTNLVISGVALGGAGAASYALNNGCGAVAAGANCVITATFTPTAQGSSMATINVTTNDPAVGSVIITVSATGAAMEEVVVTVTTEGGNGSFGWLELFALMLFAAVVRCAKLRAMLLVLGTLCAPLAFADNHESASGDSFWYAGASFGSSDGQADEGSISRGIEDAGVTVTSLSIDDTDSGFKVFGGYQATEHIGVEMGYVDLGEAGIGLQLGDVTLAQLPLISRSVSGNLSLLGTGVFGAVVVRQSISDSLGIFARVGLVSWEVDTAIGGTTSAGALQINETESGTDFTFGVGAEAWFGDERKFGVRGEWERYELGDQDAEFLSLGAMFRF